MQESRLVTSDQCLVERISRGDREASRELQRRHSASLYALAYSLLWDSEAADEVVTHAFDLVGRKASWFPRWRVSVHAWLARVTRRGATERAQQLFSSTSSTLSVRFGTTQMNSNGSSPSARYQWGVPAGI